MYNYSINLTYLDIEDDKQDTQYRKELLDVFDIKQYEHETIMTSIDISMINLVNINIQYFGRINEK